MGYKSTRKSGSASKFTIGNKVKTPSGLTGKVIGAAEFWNGWEYNVRLGGSDRHFKNRRYKESQLRKVGR